MYTGTWLRAAGHIITAVIGSGVLGLPYVVGVMGWPAGMILLFLFFVLTLWTSFLLTEVHEINGVRFQRYGELVEALLGELYWQVMDI